VKQRAISALLATRDAYSSALSVESLDHHLVVVERLRAEPTSERPLERNSEFTYSSSKDEPSKKYLPSMPAHLIGAMRCSCFII
jgi:hypothetical protein